MHEKGHPYRRKKDPFVSRREEIKVNDDVDDDR
jgi:hypothetical protein